MPGTVGNAFFENYIEEFENNYEYFKNSDSTAELDLNDLCRLEVLRDYAAGNEILYCSHLDKKNKFLDFLEWVLDECFDHNPYDGYQASCKEKDSHMFFPSRVAPEYEANFQQMVIEEPGLSLIPSKDLNPNSFAYHLNRMLRMLGCTMNKVQISPSFRGRLIDDCVQDLFKNAVADGKKYFISIIFTPYDKKYDLDMVLVDDRMIFLIMDTLIDKLITLRWFPGFGPDIINFFNGFETYVQHCRKVVITSLNILNDSMVFTNLTSEWRKFVLEE